MTGKYWKKPYQKFQLQQEETLPPIPESDQAFTRARRSNCPWCGSLRPFGVGETPGISRHHDFSLAGIAFCCGKPVIVTCAARLEVTRGREPEPEQPLSVPEPFAPPE